MNYWITTHWPPRVDELAPVIGEGLYLPHDRPEVGALLREGDLVLVYQSLSGPGRIDVDAEGRQTVVACRSGKGGVVAISRATGPLVRRAGSAPEHYTDGNTVHWQWRAPLEPETTSGFLSRVELARLLGYSGDYVFRGFGDRHSGVKRIDAEIFERIKAAFLAGQPKETPFPTRPRDGGPPGGEQAPHRRLKEYVAHAPAAALGEAGLRLRGMEYSFRTGDRADVVLDDDFGRVLGVEIEVDVAETETEGVLQALKYAAMLAPVCNRNPGDTRPVLVAYTIAPAMRALCDRYGIERFEIPRATVDAWHAARDDSVQADAVPSLPMAPAVPHLTTGA